MTAQLFLIHNAYLLLHCRILTLDNTGIFCPCHQLQFWHVQSNQCLVHIQTRDKWMMHVLMNGWFDASLLCSLNVVMYHSWTTLVCSCHSVIRIVEFIFSNLYARLMWVYRISNTSFYLLCNRATRFSNNDMSVKRHFFSFHK